MLGVGLVAAAIALFLYCRPRAGRQQPRLMKLPFMETGVPLFVVTAITMGIPMIVNAFAP